MGTKRAFDEGLQEFIEHPKHLDYANKTTSFAQNESPLETFQVIGISGDGGRKYFRIDNNPESENVVTAPDMVNKQFEITAPLPLVTDTTTVEEGAARGPVFSANLFSEYFEYTRQQIFRYEDIYSSLLDGPPRKTIPVGPNHQADIPEFNSNCNNKNGEMERFLGVCVIPACHETEDVEALDIKTDCKCLDGGSIRCVQEHVKEARLKLNKSFGNEKFIGLGMLEMGEEVASRWSEEEERCFFQVVYSNTGNFWKHLSDVFSSRTMKELVSYYFNVFILRRRAVQNRSSFLDIDSDDDEWQESYEGILGGLGEDEDFVVGDNDDSSNEDGGVDGNHDDENEVVIGLEEGPFEVGNGDE